MLSDCKNPAISRPDFRWITGTSVPWVDRATSIRARFTRSNLQMNASTAGRSRSLCGSPCRKTRLQARQAQRILGNSSQMMSSARGRRISKLTCAKLPSLIHASFACASSSKERKEERSSREPNRPDISSRQITGRPVLSPICRAREVLPLPAHPRTTMRRGDTRGIRRLFNFRARGPRAGCGGKVSRQKKPVPLFNLRVTFGSIPADRSGS